MSGKRESKIGDKASLPPTDELMAAAILLWEQNGGHHPGPLYAALYNAWQAGFAAGSIKGGNHER